MTQHLATAEDLGVANEELQSTNEELQSSNEELQTAKEELQSTNEELETVNEELESSNARLSEINDDLHNVLASVEIAIIIVDTDRRIRRFTPRTRSVMKLIPSDVGRPIADLKPTIDAPGLDAAIAAVIETLVVHESEVRSADGACYRMQIRPYRTSGDQIRGAVITFVDITALRAARDYAAAIVEAVPTPVVVLDERLRVESANHAFFAQPVTRAADVVGEPLLDLDGWNAPGLRARLDAVVATGEGFDELEVARGDRRLLVGARRIPAGHAIVVGLADITERRRLERAREAFLDAVSHELRTPLSAILLWAQALRTLAPDDPHRLQAIETIVECVGIEARLVDDLIEVAVSRSGHLEVMLESIDPCPVVADAVSRVRPEADAKHIEIAVACPPTTPIAVDPRRLGQIVTNIVSNAIKFTPTGGRVWVELARDARGLELRVRDNGPGIAPELLATVFEPFSQGDGSSTRAQRGLGIGLALARHLVERHGGTITAASPGAGHGTTVTVRIPSTALA